MDEKESKEIEERQIERQIEIQKEIAKLLAELGKISEVGGRITHTTEFRKDGFVIGYYIKEDTNPEANLLEVSEFKKK